MNYHRKRMDFGSDNEINAVSTIVGLLLPALMAPCYRFVEVGPVFIDAPEREKLIEVSADGLLKCTCEHGSNHPTVAVEIKCVYPDENMPKYPHYEMPVRYVTQCLAEMAAHKCQQLWFASFTLSSLSLINVDFDPVLWNKILQLTKEKYADPKTPAPTRLHPMSKSLRLELRDFVQNKTKFLCEIPSFRGDMEFSIPTRYQSPYAVPPDPEPDHCSLSQLHHVNHVCSDEAKLLFRTIHNQLRTQASEVLVFMLNDKDRMQNPDVPNSLPVCYALKGRSLSNYNLRHLVNTTRNELHARKIPVMCEVYDGQWQQHVMTDSHCHPLNRIRCAQKTWSKFGKMSKKRLITEIKLINKISQNDRHLLSVTEFETDTVYRYENVSVERDISGIHITALGGPKFPIPCSKYVLTWPQLEEENDEDSDSDEEESNSEASETELQQNSPAEVQQGQLNNKPKSKSRIIGLQDDEQNLLHLLPYHVLNDIELDDIYTHPDDDDHEYLPDLVNNPVLHNILTGDNCPLLRDILSSLQENNFIKWQFVTIYDLYPDILTDPRILVSRCWKAEIGIIGQVMEAHTGRQFYVSSANKSTNANIICSAFECDTLIEAPKCGRKQKLFTPKTLLLLATETISHDNYPIQRIQCSYGKLLHTLTMAEWDYKRPLGINPAVQINSDGDTIDLFSYPEHISVRNQIEHRTLDYSHILTNIRMHLCKDGYTYCKSKHFRQLATERPDILSKSAVFDQSDAQNVFTAMKFFSEPVEGYMLSKGYFKTAHFIHILRNWHRACNQRGIPSQIRIDHHVTLFKFLTNGIDFGDFPSPVCGRYVKGMPITTYEAILQNITTRIQLYSVAHNGTYNTRSVSTLSNESFFSDLTRLDKEDMAYPKACNVSKLIGKVTALNYYKHKRDK